MAVYPQVLDNASATAQATDTLGFDHAKFTLGLGAADIAITAFKLTECDTSGGSYVDIPDATFAGHLPSATDDNKLYAIFVDLLGRKRFIKVVLTAADGSVGDAVFVLATLTRGKEAPNTAAKRGHAYEVFV